MATTQIEMVNRILRRMREDTVEASNLSTNATVVSEIVADSYAEVIDEHPWESLKHKVTVDIDASKTRYILSRKVANGGGARDTDNRVCNEESELLFMNGDWPQAWLFESADAQTSEPMQWVTPEGMREYQSHTRDQNVDHPFMFTVYPEYNIDNENNDLVMEVWPIPTDSSSYMELYFFTAPDKLRADGSTDDTSVLVPARPVYQLALMYALNERGEELGEPGNVAERRYLDALGAAIERDINSATRGDRYEWRRD